MIRIRRLGLSVLSGLMLFLACPTFDLWPLMWIALVPALAVATESTTPRRAFLHGWLTGIIGNTGGFYWMAELLERFGHMPAWQALPIMMLLTSYQGLAFALYSWGVCRLHRRTGRRFVVLSPLVMVAIELLMPAIFPFYLGISQAWVTPIIQIADVTGPLGVTALMLLWTGAVYDAFRMRGQGPRRALRPLGLATAAAAIAIGYGAVRTRQVDAARAITPKVRVGVVQANVGILEKWDPAETDRLLAIHQRLSADLERAGADLIVWPESSYPYALRKGLERDFPDGDPRRIRIGFSRPLLFGALTRKPGDPRDPAVRYPYNTAMMMDQRGAITGEFDKVFLLVFGEYIPFYEQIPWFKKIFPEASHFNRGRAPVTFPFETGGRSWRLGPLICYEDIIPGFTRKLASLRPSPNLFVNITNDAWFGKTSEPYQHLALAVFRSVEHRIEMVRAVNTGVSVHIDAAGRVVKSTPSVDPADRPRPEPRTLLAEVAMMDGGGTVYAAIGDVFGWACLLALAILGWRRPRPGSQRRKNG